MSLTLKYQGKQNERNKNQQTYKQTWQGLQQQVDSYIASSLSSISQYVSGKGYLTSWRKQNYQGPIYNVQVEYTTSYDSSFDNSAETVVGKKSAQLSVRNIQMPLQSHANYRTKWNYYLLGLGSVSLPSWWTSATNTILTATQRQSYMWVKSISEVPIEPDSSGKYWVILANPTKPGVEYYDMACFVVTESAKYRSASSAGSAISKTINTIEDPSEKFGLTGGNWKHDESSVSYDGKNWIGTSVYTKSGDSNGWDTELYGD